MKNYTMQDVPNILNSISWQLKRIADSLENDADQQLRVEETTVENPPNARALKIKELLKNLNND